VNKISRKIGGLTMLKEYRKAATIKAEQFDGSEEMIKKYGIGKFKKFTQGNGESIFIVETTEGSFQLNIDDWIAIEDNGYRWTIKDDYFKKTYEEVE
jgi:hypothetical protein